MKERRPDGLSSPAVVALLGWAVVSAVAVGTTARARGVVSNMACVHSYRSMGIACMYATNGKMYEHHHNSVTSKLSFYHVFPNVQ